MIQRFFWIHPWMKQKILFAVYSACRKNSVKKYKDLGIKTEPMRQLKSIRVTLNAQSSFQYGFILPSFCILSATERIFNLIYATRNLKGN